MLSFSGSGATSCSVRNEASSSSVNMSQPRATLSSETTLQNFWMSFIIINYMSQLKFVRSKSTERVSPFGRKHSVLKHVPSQGRPESASLRSRANSPIKQSRENTDRVYQIIEMLDGHLQPKSVERKVYPCQSTQYLPLSHLKDSLQIDSLSKRRLESNRSSGQDFNINVKELLQKPALSKTERFPSPQNMFYVSAPAVDNKKYLADFMQVLTKTCTLEDQENTKPSLHLDISKIQPPIITPKSNKISINPLQPFSPNHIFGNQASTTNTLQSFNFQEILDYKSNVPDRKTDCRQLTLGNPNKSEIEIMTVPVDYETNQTDELEIFFEIPANYARSQKKKNETIIEQVEEEELKLTDRLQNISQLKTEKSEKVFKKDSKDSENQTSWNRHPLKGTRRSEDLGNQTSGRLFKQNLMTDAVCQTKGKQKNLGIFQFQIAFLSPFSKKGSAKEVPKDDYQIETPVVRRHPQIPAKAGLSDNRSYLQLTQQSDLYKSKEVLLDPPSESYDNNNYMQANLEGPCFPDAIDLASHRKLGPTEPSKRSLTSHTNYSRPSKRSRIEASTYSQHLQQLKCRYTHKEEPLKKKAIEIDPYFEYKRAINKSLASQQKLKTTKKQIVK